MAETKRISDQYTISAPTIIIDGNLTVSGSTTSVETTNSTIADNIIVLNQGETGAGITAGTSGIEIERGTSTNVSFVYDDSIDAFRILEGSGLTNVRVAEPIDGSDAATKQYVDNATSVGSVSAAGVEGSVQYNKNGLLSGSNSLLWNGFSLTVGETQIGSNSITVNNSDSDLALSGNGTGTVYMRSVVKMENEVSDPSSVSGNNQIYAKTVGDGGTGLYFVNDTVSGEFVSKSKALVFGIIF